MRKWLAGALAAGSALLAAGAASAQTEVVVVSDSFFDWFHAPFNPGCGGCGLRDFNSIYNNGHRLRRLSTGIGGYICGGEVNPVDPDWDDTFTTSGTFTTTSYPVVRYDGVVGDSAPGSEGDPPYHEPYDPAVSGAITGVKGTFALRLSSATFSSTIKGHLLIKQNNIYYVSNGSVTASSGGGPGSWVQFQGGNPSALSAGDFSRVVPDGANDTLDSGQNPDFSATAAPLQFGFAIDMSVGSFPIGQTHLYRQYNLDDLQISVVQAGPVETPVLGPVGFGVLVAALATGGAALASRARRRSA
jgi:hypothetical protein